MALVNFSHRTRDIPVNTRAVYVARDGYWLWRTHEGLCLRERERNTYHDSDFFMTVWNEEKGEPEEIMFATTRGWTYPAMGSFVDATPEVQAKYAAWMRARELERIARDRKGKAAVIRANRKIASRIAREHGVPYSRLISLRRDAGYTAILGLFNPRLRSGFKQSLRDQVLVWLRDKAPRYPFPLSGRQMSALAAKPFAKRGF